MKPDGSASKPVKAPHYILKTPGPIPRPASRPIITPRRLETAKSSVGQKSKDAQPASAPAAAGRSPKSKRVGILSRRRVSSSPFTRVDPPAYGKGSSGLPFSIDAALSATVPSYDAKTTQAVDVPNLDQSLPDSWLFNIYEDTPDEDLGHSVEACKLSSGKTPFPNEDDGEKENVPPLDDLQAYARISPTAARADVMTDEPRTPLGDLNAKDFYADGCDAASYIVIPAEKPCGSNVDLPLNCDQVSGSHSLAKPQVQLASSSQNGWQEIVAQIQNSKKRSDVRGTLNADEETKEPAEIEIWESESAKEEDSAIAQNLSFSITEPLNAPYEAESPSYDL